MNYPFLYDYLSHYKAVHFCIFSGFPILVTKLEYGFPVSKVEVKFLRAEIEVLA